MSDLDAGAYSKRTYRDRWGDDGPVVEASIDYRADQLERALAALDKVYDGLREDIMTNARAYAIKCAEVPR